MTPYDGATSNNASKKANSEAPAWVSKVSSGNMESNIMHRKTVYKYVRCFFEEK